MESQVTAGKVVASLLLYVGGEQGGEPQYHRR